MSLTGKNKVDVNKYELTIHVDADALEKAIGIAYRKNVKKINVPGFRQGKAPRKIVEKLYGESVFFDDAINDIYPDALANAVEEAGLVLVARPEVEAKEIDKANGFDFTAVCIVKPEVAVKEYKGIEATKNVKTVAEAEVEERITSMRDRNARLVEVEGRAAQKGDTMTFDFDGYLNGVPFDGGKAEGFSLELGSGQFIPGFEEQLEGHVVDDEFEVNVTFPEDYHAEELKGKPVVFQCKVREIKSKELPAADDEFAKDVSEFDTLDELKADIKGKMQEQADHTAEDEVENALIDKVIESMEAVIPQEMYDARVDELVNNFQYRLQSQGMNVQTYLQYTGMDMDAFRGTFAEQARRQVKVRLALEEIVRLESIVPNEEDIEAEYKKAAENYKTEVEKIKELIPSEDFIADIAVNKAIDFVKANAKITEQTADAPVQTADAPVQTADAPEKKAKKPAKAKKETVSEE